MWVGKSNGAPQMTEDDQYDSVQRERPPTLTHKHWLSAVQQTIHQASVEAKQKYVEINYECVFSESKRMLSFMTILKIN